MKRQWYSFICLFLCSCGTSNHLALESEGQWELLLAKDAESTLDLIQSKEVSSASMRHRINLQTKIDKRSFEQSFVTNGKLFSLSFYAPAYVKILFRIIKGDDKSVLIDFQNRLGYELDPSNSIPLGDERFASIGRVYPELLQGSISASSVEDARRSKFSIRTNRKGDSLLLEIVQDDQRREYLFDRFTGAQYCLKSALVELLKGNNEIVVYHAREVDKDTCTPSKVSIDLNFTSANLEAVLLINQGTIEMSPYPFSTEIPKF